MSEHQVIYSKKLRKHIYLRAATPAAAALPDASPATCREAIKIIRPLPVLPLHSAAAPYLSPSPTIYSSAELYPHGPHVMCLPFASPTHYLPPLYLHRGCAANHGLLGHHGFVPPIIPPSVHRAPPPPPPSIFYRGHDRVLLGPDLELTRVSSSCSIQMPSSPESCSAVETLSPASSENIQAEKKTRKRRQRADDLIPPGVDLSIDDIANSKMDEFNAKIADKPEPLQLKLKDSRRRKKNRIAAKNSRDKKEQALVDLRDKSTRKEDRHRKLITLLRRSDEENRLLREKNARLEKWIRQKRRGIR